MSELLVSGHYPNINQNDIPRNATIKIFLDDEINTASITANCIVVSDYLYTPVDGLVSWAYTNQGTPSGIANILTFTPTSYFDPETNYSVFVNKYPDSVTSVNSTYLEETYRYNFTTGIGVIDDVDPTYLEQIQFDLDAAIARSDWAEAARLQAILDDPYIAESGVADVTVTLPDNLILNSTYPSDTTSNIPLDDLQFIKLTFNDDLPASGIDYSSYISIITKDVLE